MVLLLAVALVIVGPMFRGAFGLADDHQVPFIGELLRAEGFAPVTLRWIGEQDGRFRPLYWPLYFGEIGILGHWFAAYVFDRLLLVLACLVAGYAALRIWFPATPAVLGAIVVVAGPQAAAFWFLGTQEAWAMPLALGAVALVGRRRFWGLGLAVAAAYIKEPFILSGLVTVGWAWWLGARRSAVVAGGIIAAAGVLWIVAMLRFGWFYGDRVPLAARYLLPGTFAVGLLVAWVAARRRLGALLAGSVAGFTLVLAVTGASAQAARTRTIAAFVAELHAMGRPMFVTGNANTERVLALARYMPDRIVGTYPPLTHEWRAFPAKPAPGCVEVAVSEPSGVCPIVVRWP